MSSHRHISPPQKRVRLSVGLVPSGPVSLVALTFKPPVFGASSLVILTFSGLVFGGEQAVSGALTDAVRRCRVKQVETIYRYI
jgi:hypothetical protein